MALVLDLVNDLHQLVGQGQFSHALYLSGALSLLDPAPLGYEVCNIHGDIVARMGVEVKQDDE